MWIYAILLCYGTYVDGHCSVPQTVVDGSRAYATLDECLEAAAAHARRLGARPGWNSLALGSYLCGLRSEDTQFNASPQTAHSPVG